MVENRRFPPPWTVDRPHPDSFVVKDGNGIVVATVHCRDVVVWTLKTHVRRSAEDRQGDLAHHRVHDEWKGFYVRGPGNYRWKAARPFHVALEDSYIRANYDVISELCRLNGMPFNATGEKIRG
jgi:hypothetical protein